MINIICATQLSEDEFFREKLLGQMLHALPLRNVKLVLSTRNTKGLPEIYNSAIDSSIDESDILVFMHDDACFLDYWWWEQVVEGLSRFDVIGLAGNRRRLANQPAWCFIDKNLAWDNESFLSGVVGHGIGFPQGKVSIYGPPGQEVKLLDGVMLATYKRTLIRNNLRFDDRFDFHFYDMDFCRQAELKKLRLGTWALSVLHASGGNFGGSKWMEGAEKYFIKWGS